MCLRIMNCVIIHRNPDIRIEYLLDTYSIWMLKVKTTSLSFCLIAPRVLLNTVLYALQVKTFKATFYSSSHIIIFDKIESTVLNFLRNSQTIKFNSRI